jgi:hypothetical protein
VAEWSGSAADAYRQWAGRREQSMRALAKASDAMAAMTEGAGALVGTVRLMVRDAVAVVVSRLIVYAGELLATAGLATPLVIGQVATLCATWGARIAGWLRDLLASLRRMGTAAADLTQKIKDLVGLRGGSGSGPEVPEPPKRPREPERLHELGVDPAVGGYRQSEAETAHRVEQALGIELRRSPDGKVDWVGPDGRTYDAVGNFDARFFDRQWPHLQTRILDHVQKADHVPIDVARFTPEQKQVVREFVEANGLGPQVFIVGE